MEQLLRDYTEACVNYGIARTGLFQDLTAAQVATARTAYDLACAISDEFEHGSQAWDRIANDWQDRLYQHSQHLAGISA